MVVVLGRGGGGKEGYLGWRREGGYDHDGVWFGSLCFFVILFLSLLVLVCFLCLVLMGGACMVMMNDSLYFVLLWVLMVRWGLSGWG